MDHVSWSHFELFLKKPPRGGRPNTQNQLTVALQNFTTLDLLIFIMCEGTCMNRNSLKREFGWGLGYIWLHTTLEGPWPIYMIWKCLEMAFWDFFWDPTISCPWLLAHVWSGPKVGTNLGLIIRYDLCVHNFYESHHVLYLSILEEEKKGGGGWNFIQYIILICQVQFIPFEERKNIWKLDGS